jgi:predicted cupin superfamily sugar epimerase
LQLPGDRQFRRSTDRDAGYWISKLALIPHPEGGHYRETYRAQGGVPATGSDRHPEGRPWSTAIYYLLRSGEVSRLHRLRSDELFHFYAGSRLVIHVLGEDGSHRDVALGRDPDRGETLQAVVPAGSWFGATVGAEGSFALVGCTVAPGFEYRDFELADRATLLGRFPQHRALIELLT